MEQTHVVKHKNIDVASVSIIGGYVVDIGKIYEAEHMPFLVKEDAHENIRLINNWVANRGIPFSREDYELIMEKCGVENSRELSLLGMALNLTDHYWIQDRGDDRTWHDVNYFDNNFSEGIGKIIPELSERYMNFFHPDFSSNGRLKKMWMIEDGQRILYKAGSGDIRQEPYNEKIATEICRELGIECVEYQVVEHEGDVYSKCPCMVDGNSEFIDAFKVLLHGEKKADKYENYIHICESHGLANARECLEKMLVLDYVIRNTDRNEGNYGIIRNSQTLQWERMARLFDNGNSLWYNVNINNNIGKDIRSTCKSFLGENEQNIQLLSGNYHFDAGKLVKYGEVIAHILLHTGMDKERAEKIGSSFMGRVDALDQTINHHRDTVKIAR